MVWHVCQRLPIRLSAISLYRPPENNKTNVNSDPKTVLDRFVADSQQVFDSKRPGSQAWGPELFNNKNAHGRHCLDTSSLSPFVATTFSLLAAWGRRPRTEAQPLRKPGAGRATQAVFICWSPSGAAAPPAPPRNLRRIMYFSLTGARHVTRDHLRPSV